MRILVITPVRDEEKYISTTIKCMINQSIVPAKWIIVNDGSRDRTEEIIKEYIGKISFLDLVSLPDRGNRKPGRGVVEAFYEGFNKINKDDYDIIAKVDGDLEFPDNTNEVICTAFAEDPMLGITGGTRYERLDEKGGYKKDIGSKGYVCGPHKFYRVDCFRDINGLIKRAGWDGVDIIRAHMKGWKTGTIDSLNIIHLRPTGTARGEGIRKANEKYGDISYYMGGYFWYFLLRVLGRAIEARSLNVACSMLKGYFRDFINRKPRESREFRKFLKRQELSKLLHWIKQIPHLKDAFHIQEKPL